MDKAVLEKIKADLLLRKAKLEEELSQYTDGDNVAVDAKFPDFGDKEDDNASEVAAYSDNLSLEATLDKTLRDINKALANIAKGEYGICRYCGQEIDERRLQARPVSSSCISCKNKLKKN